MYSKTPDALGLRLARRLDVAGECWLWQGSHNGGGYGQIAVKTDGKWAPEYVHRLVFEALIGPIPQGMTLDHLCRTPACANPAHLEIVTDRENIHRGHAPSIVIWRTGKCGRGHPMVGANVGRRSNGNRRCVQCSRDYAEQRRRSRGASVRGAYFTRVA